MNNKSYFLLFMLLFVCAGCEYTDDSVPEPQVVEITIPSEFHSIELDSNVLTKSITFTATEDWIITLSESVKSAPSWIEVSPMKGSAGSATLSVTLEPNESVEDRAACVTITAGDVEESIEVIQKAFAPTLSLSTTSKSLTNASGSFTITLSSNIDWQASDVPDWMSLSATSGSSSQTITVSYDANSATTSRTATIKFTSADYDNEAEIVVTQAAFVPTLSLGTTSTSLTYSSGSFTLSLSSNVDWQASDVPDWMSLSATSGSSSQTITVSYDANSATTSRTATIKFTSAEYDNEAEIVVTQAAFVPALSLSSSNVNLDYTAAAFVISISSNADWQASGVPDWMTLSATSGSGSQSLTFGYQANSSKESRTAVVKFSTQYSEVEITIVQVAPQLGDLEDGGSL